ncbi:hypothetical protein M422DRAFT_247545 [Sphaerobolus stellatus SS14]|nr:hypothetical protein M422DRAFT_247545 [Sphaerobolus stellatus SS14]
MLGMWLLKAELRQLAPENCFRWKGQQAGVVRGVQQKGGAGGQTKAVEPKATNEGANTNTGSMAIVGIGGLGTMKAAAETANDEVGQMSSGSDRDSKRALEDEESSQPGRKPWKTLTTSQAGDSAIPQLLVPEISGNGERSVEKKPATGRKFRAVLETKARRRERPAKVQKKGGGSNTDGHDASEALVVRGAPSETFNGDMGMWFQDFKHCCDLLNWDESVVEGPMGSPVPLSAKFIDGMEVRAPLVLGAQLDISVSEDTLTDGVVKIIEDILLTSKPLPKPSIVQMLGQKNCASVFKVLLKLAKELLLAITTYATYPLLCVMQVGGNLALFPGLRAVELLQQYVHNVDKDPKRRSQVNLLLEQYDTTLAQEAWRRWAIMSFAQSIHTYGAKLYEAWLVRMETAMRGGLDADEWFGLQWRNGLCPKIIDDIAHLAARCVRPIQADDFWVPYIDVTWRQEDIRLGMESWSKEMPKTSSSMAALLMDASVSSAVVPTEGVIRTTCKPRSKADPTNSPIRAFTHLKGTS